MTTKTMDFETTPFKTGSIKTLRDKAGDNMLDKISTGRILWHLVKRHKFGIVSIWAFVITITWAFPPVWDLLRSLMS